MILVALLLVPAGIGLYSIYTYHLTGHLFEWKTKIELWGYYFPGGTPWLATSSTLSRTSSSGPSSTSRPCTTRRTMR